MARGRSTEPVETPSFEESMRAAEEASGIPPDTELYGDLAAMPAADDAGRVPASRPPEEQAAAEEPATVEEPEVVETPAETLLAGKYRDVQALEAAHMELQRTLDAQGNELGQLRQLREEFETLRDEMVPQQAPVNDATVAWFDEQAQANPGQAAEWARNQGQPILYDRAIREWYDQDPVTAGRYERALEYQQQQYALQQQIQPQLQTAGEMAHERQMAAALEVLQGRYDDFGQVVGPLDQQRVQEIVQAGFSKALIQELQGDQQAKERVFEHLYRWVKSDQADLLVNAARETAAQSAEETRQEKISASVASATTTTPDAVPETEAERMQRVWAQQRPSMRAGWTGQDSRR